MAEKQNYPLYELGVEEFYKLAIDLLLVEEKGIIITQGAAPAWLDAIGEHKTVTGSNSIAIEVKHHRKFDIDAFKTYIDCAHESRHKYNEYIYITSSPVDDFMRYIIDSSTTDLPGDFSLIDQEIILKLLDSNPKIAAKYFVNAKARMRKRLTLLWIGIIFFAASVSGLIYNIHSFYKPSVNEQTELQLQINNVEASLSNLSSLQKSLKDIKAGLQSQQSETARINAEYKKAQALKSLTNEQLQQIRSALKTQTYTQSAINYFLAFIIGIATSYIASALYDMRKRRRALE